jgi:DnaJ-class molecular chaperone
MSNPYEILGVQPGVSRKDLDKAYRALLAKNKIDYSAEASRQKAQEEKIKKINEAYEDIKSGNTGQKNNQSGAHGFDFSQFGFGGFGNNPFNFEFDLGDLFRGGFQKPKRQRVHQIEMTLLETLSNKKVRINNQEFTVPFGVRDGDTFMLRNQGSHNDIEDYVKIYITPQKGVARIGNDLWVLLRHNGKGISFEHPVYGNLTKDCNNEFGEVLKFNSYGFRTEHISGDLIALVLPQEANLKAREILEEYLRLKENVRL